MEEVKTANILLIVLIVLVVIVLFKTHSDHPKMEIGADGKTVSAVKKASFWGDSNKEKE
jgi:ABC-type cobalt transport system substrate-binding protein